MSIDLTALFTNRIVVDDQAKGPYDTPSRAVWNAKEAFKHGHQSIIIEKKVNGSWVTNEEATKSYNEQIAKLGPDDMYQQKVRSGNSKPSSLKTSLSELARTASFLARSDDVSEDGLLLLEQAIVAVKKNIPARAKK
jgi:hypothetical protein